MSDHEVTMEDLLEYIGEQLCGIRIALEKLVEIANTTKAPDSDNKHYFTETL